MYGFLGLFAKPPAQDPLSPLAWLEALVDKSQLGPDPIKTLGAGWRGVFFEEGSLMNNPGLYAVIDSRPFSTGSRLLDIGESAQIRDRIKHHERRPCWEGHSSGQLGFATWYLPDSTDQQRRNHESFFRWQFGPVCGVR